MTSQRDKDPFLFKCVLLCQHKIHTHILKEAYSSYLHLKQQTMKQRICDRVYYQFLVPMRGSPDLFTHSSSKISTNRRLKSNSRLFIHLRLQSTQAHQKYLFFFFCIAVHLHNHLRHGLSGPATINSFTYVL